MDVLVRGKNCAVGRTVHRLAEEKLARVARLARGAHRADVEFTEQGQHHSPPSTECEVTIHLRRNIIRAHASAADASSALDLTLDKIEQQLARLKGKRVTRRNGRRRARRAPVEVPLEALVDDNIERDDELRIVREKNFDSKPMNPEEAALQMELLGHDFFLFSNSENGNAAVIYRRHDGDLGLIETAG